MIGTDTIRRHPDGAIDFDFYRRDAAAQRRQAMRNIAGLRIVRRATLGAACLLGLALLLVAAPHREISIAARAFIQPAN